MSSIENTVAAGDTSGRPAQPERGQRFSGSVLSLTAGAGPEQSKEDRLVSQRRSDRPVRFDDPARNAAYWARIDACVAQAPPLTDEQKAAIRTAFHQPASRAAA